MGVDMSTFTTLLPQSIDQPCMQIGPAITGSRLGRLDVSLATQPYVWLT